MACASAGGVETIVSLARLNEDFLASGTPGYYNNEGRPHERPPQNSNCAAGTPAFFELLENWQQAGDLEDLELR